MHSKRAVLRNLFCVAALAGVSVFWFAHAQNAATDAERFVGASRALEAEGWRVSRRWFEAGARTAWHRHPGAQILFVEKGRARVAGSGWQSLARGTGSIEVDQLNGEVVLLGRLHGVPTPVNELLQQVGHELVQAGAAPGSLTEAELLARLG